MNCALIDRLLCPNVASQPVNYQDVVLAIVLSEVKMQSVPREDVKHIAVGNLYSILSVALCKALTGITSSQFLLCILVHSLPPNLSSQLLNHSIITTVSICMCYV